MPESSARRRGWHSNTFGGTVSQHGFPASWAARRSPCKRSTGKQPHRSPRRRPPGTRRGILSVRCGSSNHAIARIVRRRHGRWHRERGAEGFPNRRSVATLSRAKGLRQGRISQRVKAWCVFSACSCGALLIRPLSTHRWHVD